MIFLLKDINSLARRPHHEDASKVCLKIISKSTRNWIFTDELVIETKKLFETEGMVGFLRVLLILLDHLIYPMSLGKGCGLACCDHSHYCVNKREEKKIRTSVGLLNIVWTRLRCEGCGESFIPLREYLGVKKFERKTTELERIVANIVAEQSYGQTTSHLKTVGEIPVPHTTLHRWIMSSSCDEINAKNKVASIVADGTGYKIKPDLNCGSNRGEVKILLASLKIKNLYHMERGLMTVGGILALRLNRPITHRLINYSLNP